MAPQRVEQGFAVGDRVATLSQHAYAEYDLASADATVRLPDTLAAHPFPAEPLGCAMNIFRRSDIRGGQTVAIIGLGFLGALLTRLASRTGARVIAVSRRPYSLAVARTFGAEADSYITVLGRRTGMMYRTWRLTMPLAAKLLALGSLLAMTGAILAAALSHGAASRLARIVGLRALAALLSRA